MEISEGKKVVLKNNPISKFIRNNIGTLLGLIILCVLLSFSSDYFLTGKNLLTVLRQICINALLAFGMTFVLIIGGIDLTVGSIVGMSGVAVVMLIEYGVPIVMAVIIALILGGCVGVINGIIIAYAKMPAFIVTLSMSGVIRGIAYIITDGRSVASGSAVFTKIGNSYFWKIPIPIYIVFVVILLISIILYKTRFGRRMYAVGGNQIAARYTGIEIKSLIVKVYIISGMLASLAGIILASRMYSGQPTAGQNYESDAIAAAVLGGTSFTGGIGTIGGTLIGALVIGVLGNGLNLLHISSYVQMVIKGIVIILAVGIDFFRNRNNDK